MIIDNRHENNDLKIEHEEEMRNQKWQGYFDFRNRLREITVLF